MLSQFFEQQLDYIFFVCGLAFILLLVTCVNLYQLKKQRLPWIFLVGFALFRGISEWVEILVLAFGDNLYFSITRLILTVLAFAFLFEFGRAGLKSSFPKVPGRWIHLPLLVGIGLGGFYGIAGVNAAARLIYGFTGGLLSAYVLFSASRSQKSIPLTFAALLMAIGAVAAGVIVPEAGFFPASLINQDTMFTRLGVPIQVFRAGIALLFAYAMWAYYQKTKPPVFSEDGSQLKNFYDLQFIMILAILLLLGWLATEKDGNLASKSIRRDLLNLTSLTRTSISSTQFKLLSASPTDVDLPSYISIRQKLLEIKETDPKLRDVYLMILKGGKIYFAVDGLPLDDANYTDPGVLYEDPPLELYHVFFTEKTQVIGPYFDKYGSFLSGYTSIRDDISDKVIGVLGIDISGVYLQRYIAQNRLVTLAITMLVILIFIGFFTNRKMTWEANQRIAASQNSLAQAQTIARIGSWTWNFSSNQLSWSAEMYQIFGRPAGQEVRDFSDFQEYFSAPDWNGFAATVQKAVLKGQDFELENRILRPDQNERFIVTRGKVRVEDNGNIIQLLGISQDITEQKLANEKVRILFRAIEQSPISVVITNSDGKIEYVNPKFSSLTGYTLQEAIGQNPRILKTGETSDEEYANLWKSILSGKEWQGEFLNKKKNGDQYWESAVISPIVAENGEITHFVAVKEDITERKQAALELSKTHEALEKSNQELEKASKVKSEFLANMSHEIRTPLNAIIGMTGLLLNTPLDTEQANYAETVRTSGEVLLTLINDILDFSKIEAQKMELENQSFDLRRCIEESLDLVVTKASEKKIELAYLIEDELPNSLIGDVTRLRQILVNLLSNAIKFTETGEVVISVRGQLRDQHQYQLHFAIRDTGLGIPPDRLSRLFQSFSQVDASTTRRFGGTGLGLAISKRLSELMGGTMWVESTGIPGQGSTFHFTILAQESSDPIQEPDAEEPADLAGLKILIVDDNKTNREILVRYTESWKMIPQAVSTPQEALDLLRNQSAYDLAILDLQMPEMDGLSLAKEIQTLLQEKAFPLILLSSLGYREAQSEETRFTAYLTKPIKPSQLFDTLGTTINHKSGLVVKKFRPNPMPFNQNLGQDHPLRVLVVDDNNVNQIVATSLLGKIGYRADLASNGLEALDALWRQPYDIIFMDGQMPEMDGEEATRQIRQRLPASQQPCIVAMTANAMQGDRERYLACGMDDYISKPIRVEELVRVLTNAQPVNSDPAEIIEIPAGPQGEIAPMPETQPVTPVVPPVENPTPDSAGEQRQTSIDPAVLQEFLELIGDDGQATVANLVRLYLDDCPLLIDKMRQALSAADYDSLRRQAHTLKGNSNQIGAGPLAEISAALEQLAKSGSCEGAEGVIQQIEIEFERVKIGLNSIIEIQAEHSR